MVVTPPFSPLATTIQVASAEVVEMLISPHAVGAALRDGHEGFHQVS
jgi:hypothetical protein